MCWGCCPKKTKTSKQKKYYYLEGRQNSCALKKIIIQGKKKPQVFDVCSSAWKGPGRPEKRTTLSSCGRIVVKKACVLPIFEGGQGRSGNSRRTCWTGDKIYQGWREEHDIRHTWNRFIFQNHGLVTWATQVPSHICHLHYSSQQLLIPIPLSEARDWTHILMDTSQVRYRRATTGTPAIAFKTIFQRSRIPVILFWWGRVATGHVGPILVAITSPIWAASKAYWLIGWTRALEMHWPRALLKAWMRGHVLLGVSEPQFVWESWKPVWLEERVAGGKQCTQGLGPTYRKPLGKFLSCLWKRAVVDWAGAIHMVREASTSA